MAYPFPPGSVTMTGDLSPKGGNNAIGSMPYYDDKRFLLAGKPHLQYFPHGQKRTLPKNQGNTVKFLRYKPLPPVIQKLSESSALGDGSELNRQKLQTFEIEAMPERYYGIVAVSHIEDITAFKSTLNNAIEIAGQQAAESIDEIVKNAVGAGLMRRRADANSTYQKNLAVTASGSNSTNSLIIPELANGVSWDDSTVTFTSQTDPSYGITVKVTDFNSTTGNILFTPSLPAIPVAGTKFRIVSNQLINENAAGNKLTSSALRLAIRDLKENLAKPMQDGNWVCIIDPYMEYDFMNDDSWTAVSQYQDKRNIYNGEIGRMWNIRFVGASRVYKELETGEPTDDASDSVHFATLLGKEAYGVVELEGQGKKVNLRKWDQLGQSIALRNEITWEVMFATKVLNGCFGVNIACAVTE